MMDTLLADLRYAVRTLRKSPGFATAAILTLALAIGSNTAIFSVVNGVLLQPLPYPNSDRIVQVFQTAKTGERNSVTEPNFADWKAQARSFSALAMASAANTVTVNGLSEPVRVLETYVSRDFFPVFGVKPVLGRTFVDDELRPGAPSSGCRAGCLSAEMQSPVWERVPEQQGLENRKRARSTGPLCRRRSNNIVAADQTSRIALR